MKNKMLLLTYLLLLAFGARPPRAVGQTTNHYVVTYQGLLREHGLPAEGLYDNVSSIYDAETGGQLVFPPTTNKNVRVQSGLFAIPVEMPFSDATALPGPDDDWWIIHCLKHPTDLLCRAMTPAQKLTRTPRSLYAEVAGTVRDGAVTADKLAAGAVAAHSLQAGSVTADKLASGAAVKSLNGLQDQVTLVGGEGISVTPTGDSTLVLAAVAACSTNCYWMLTGNPSTDGGAVNYLGTTDKQPLNLRVGGAAADRVMRYEFPVATASPRLIGGHQGNSVTATGGTIGGGGFSSEPNSVAATYSTIAGGSTNSIQSTSDYGFIGGGRRNLVTTGADYGVLVGGRDNTIGLSADYASLLGGYRNTNEVPYGTIGGGNRNLVKSNALFSVVGGGQGNTVGNSATAGAIGGGATNTIADYADYVTVGGGTLNAASADFTTISGGANSFIAALSSYGTVGGGERNTILQQSPHATVAGGGQNEINYNSQAASIGGGKTNRIRIFSPFATIAGGGGNTVQEFSPNATIGGVIRNNAGATGLVGAFDTVMAKKDIAAWNADVIADNGADALVVRLSGGTTEMPVRWVATVRTTEVMY